MAKKTPKKKPVKRKATAALVRSRKVRPAPTSRQPAKRKPRKPRPPAIPATALRALTVLHPPGLLPDHNPPAMQGLDLLPEQPVITLVGLSLSVFTRKEIDALLEPFPDDQCNIKPTTYGEVYVEHIFYRERLSRVIGVGAWGMQPMGQPTINDRSLMVMPWALYARGNALAWTWGQAQYHATDWQGNPNPKANWGDTSESCKSNALSRLCKDIPMAAQCWSRRWTAQFKRRACVRVWVAKRSNDTEAQWRTLDSDPLKNEMGIHPDSPNQDVYTAPAGAAGQQHYVDATPGQRKGPTDNLLTLPKAERLLRIAREVGWKRPELVTYLQATGGLKVCPSAASGTGANAKAAFVAWVRTMDWKRYQDVVSDIQSGTGS